MYITVSHHTVFVYYTNINLINNKKTYPITMKPLPINGIAARKSNVTIFVMSLGN
jgi:hypothetical protein